MKALIYEGPGRLVVKDIPEPAAGPEDLLLRVRAAGICGSDLELARGNRPDVIPPRVPGHEAAGEVIDAGAQVTKFRVGDSVVVEPIVSCGRCDNCKVGRYNICRDLKFLGVHADGAFAEFLSIPEIRAYSVPKHFPFDEAAVFEPTAVAVHIVRRAHISLGDTVLVLGAGPIGLQVVQVAKTRGAGSIIVTDVLDHRLDLARKLGANIAVNVARNDPLQCVSHVTGGEGADIVIETAGKSSTIQQTMDLVRVGGRILIAGLSVQRFITDPPTFWMKQLLKEVTVETSRSYVARDWNTAIKLATTGDIKCRPLVTHRFTLEDAQRAFEVGDKKLEDSVKVLLMP